MILTIQTTYCGPGGIPAYNRTVCRALAELDEGLAGTERQVFLVMDEPADLQNQVVLPNMKLEAFGGSRLALVWRAIRIAMTRRIDVLLVGHLNYAPIGFLLKCLQPKLRYGVVAYGVEAWNKLGFAKRYSVSRADFVMSISEYTKQRLVEENGVPGDRIKLLPPSLDCEESDCVEATVPKQPDSETIRLLSVCRLDESERYKGVDTVIDALQVVSDQFTNFEYNVIGGGNDLDRHKELAEEKGLARSIHFLGAVPAALLRAYYQNCDVFLMPSAGEGFGIVYLEAMEFAKPVIAANIGAVPEVVQGGETGLLIEYGNVNQLASAITVMCREREMRRKLGEAGRRRLHDNFRFEHFKQRFQDIIRAEMPRSIGDGQSMSLADSVS